MRATLNRSAIALTLLFTSVAGAEPGTITVHADQTLFRLSDMMIGANIEDLHYQLTGGLSSQLIHGESFFEPSPTQLAASTGAVRSFTTWMGQWKLNDDEELIVTVPGEKGKAGARLTSDRTAATDVVETSVDINSREVGGLLFDVGPVDGDDKWDWYTGYTVELQPVEGAKASTIILKKATRPSEHRELARTAVTVSPGDWVGLSARQVGKSISIVIDNRVVLEYQDGEPLKPARIGMFTRGDSQFKHMQLKTATGGWWEVPFRHSDLLTKPSDAISLRWEKIQAGTSHGEFNLDPTGSQDQQTQSITYVEGEGELGIGNAGLKRWGINLVADKPYEGFITVKATEGTQLYVSLRNADDSVVYSTHLLTTHGKADEFQRMAFTLTPNRDDAQGHFAITLRQPGTITLGYAFLQPGEWGRYKGLPIRKDLAEALVAQGIRVLRMNGGMIERPGYRWKSMQGPRELRPAYDGFYDRYCGNGFGVIEYLNFCEAAGITAFTGLNVDETPDDVADFIAYANGPVDSPGSKRRAADGHPTPYGLKYYQVGNETNITSEYVEKFKAVAAAIWKVDPQITLVPSGQVYTFNDGHDEQSMRTRLAPHLDITRFAHEQGKAILWDCHAFLTNDDPAEGMLTTGSLVGAAEFSRWLEKLAPECGVVPVGVMELNAGRFDFLRGLKHALEMNLLQRQGDRIRALAMPNVSQPWGVSQTDWKAVLWAQGNISYTPTTVWLQPAYYVDQMIARNWAPLVVKTESTGPEKVLDVTARRSEDGKTLIVQVVNLSSMAATSPLSIQGFTPAKAAAHVEELSSTNLRAVNTLEQPERIRPAITSWEHHLTNGQTSRTFPAQSFTVIRFE